MIFLLNELVEKIETIIKQIRKMTAHFFLSFAKRFFLNASIWLRYKRRAFGCKTRIGFFIYKEKNQQKIRII